MAFKENLFCLRKYFNFSQEELAEKLNVTRQAISKWENGQSTPDLEMIIALSELFGVTTDQLLISLTVSSESVEDEKKAKKDKINKIFSISGLIFLLLLSICGFTLFILNAFLDIFDETLALISFCFGIVPIIFFAVLFMIYLVMRILKK